MEINLTPLEYAYCAWCVWRSIKVTVHVVPNFYIFVLYMFFIVNWIPPGSFSHRRVVPSLPFTTLTWWFSCVRENARGQWLCVLHLAHLLPVLVLVLDVVGTSPTRPVPRGGHVPHLWGAWRTTPLCRTILLGWVPVRVSGFWVSGVISWAKTPA